MSTECVSSVMSEMFQESIQLGRGENVLETCFGGYKSQISMNFR